MTRISEVNLEVKRSQYEEKEEAKEGDELPWEKRDTKGGLGRNMKCSALNLIGYLNYAYDYGYVCRWGSRRSREGLEKNDL